MKTPLPDPAATAFLRQRRLGIPSNMVAQFYFDCVEEVNEIWKGITFSGEDKDEGEHKGM